MIRLYLFPPWNGMQPSPPCSKVESYLTLAGLAFERIESWDMGAAPKGKLPYIEDGDTVVPDSWFILKYLQATYGDPLDAALDPHQQMLTHALGRVLDESLYYAIGYFRWLTDDGFEIAREAMFGALPDAERDAAANHVRELAQAMMHYQGFGRHTVEELLQIVEADLQTLDTALGDKPFLLAESPASIDCAGFAIIENTLNSPVSPRLPEVTRRHPALLDYLERMRAALG